MIKLLTNIFCIFILCSCQIKDNNYLNKNKIENKVINQTNFNNSTIKYVVEDSYFIEGVKYIPEENYNYSEIGLASFYGKEFHNTKTLNNDLNKVTELLGRHKTLPLPSIVKVTNLDNGFSLTVKINDRHNDNSSLIQLSRKTAQLLKFYKNKIARVKVEILSDPSKQMKIVTESMNELNFNATVESAPTESVSISNIDNELSLSVESLNIDQPIQIGLEKIISEQLYLRIYNFKSYQEVKDVILELDISYKFTTKNEGNSYSLQIGPLENLEANNLVLSFISKGYKKNEFILQ